MPEIPVIDDGSAHRYIARLDRFGEDPPRGTWRQLGVYFGADEPVTADLLSVSLVPKEADYAAEALGVRMSEIDGEHRRAIYTHGAARLEYRVSIPEDARLDFGLGLASRGPLAFLARVLDHLPEPHGQQVSTMSRKLLLDRRTGPLMRLGLLSAASLKARTAISADRIVESTAGGFKFPDGSLQTTASAPGALPATGQEECWDSAGVSESCSGTDQDSIRTSIRRQTYPPVSEKDGGGGWVNAVSSSLSRR